MSLREFAKTTGSLTAEPGKTFTLASGKQSDRYFDARRVALADQDRLNEIAERICGHVSPDVVAIGAVPTGGLVLLGPVLLAARNYLHTQPLVGFYVRDEPKSYGTGNQIEGALALAPPGPVCLIEDTVSTGQGLLPSIALLDQCGRKVSEVVCVVDRGLGGRERLGALGIPLRALFTLDDSGNLAEAA